ncbi:hypothetical protein QFZ87_000914 [Bacillus sp. SLBN-46]|uniref:hypothetical protein n=1 Tax=Bacillus sp. SLBN-46 TaxID=3042283 RepID=UPI00285BC980|nr:hypothetical protein [Bacillus sp. SLBN-46]MDR6121317.1 hypothetical protein [Bacillus sp. SLBN-46]
MLKFKHILVFQLILLLTVITSGCDIVDQGKAAYNYKTAYVAMIGEVPTANSSVGELFYLAERDIKYHLSDGNSGSATANLAYNISYILNTPAKLIHNIRYDYLMTQKEFKVDKKVEQSIEGKVGNALLDFSMVVAIVMDIFYAALGLILSIIMLFVGTFIGLIAHPIDTLLNIPAVIWGLLKTVIAAVVNIFSWEQ